MRRDTLLAFASILLILAALFVNPVRIAVPAIRHVPGKFDADRAKARLAFILGDERPHPTDGPGDDAVRTRLVASVRQIGLVPIIRDQMACNDVAKARFVACARVRNVIAELGPSRGKALLLSAHYDSVPAGPGASDDGIGVATLLELGSILRNRALGRPVILLFNEGEEEGLLGARAFLADPLSQNVDSLLNFDARGVNGPVTMFETNEPNGSAISAYARAVQRPYASSLSTDVARLIPNDTDVTVFKERPWVTLNSAIVGNETRYHSGGDELDGLDSRSLQDMGDEGLALASALSTGVSRAAGNRVFADVAQTVFVDLPLSLAAPWLALLLASFTFIAVRSGRLLRGTALVSGSLVAATLLSFLAVTIMGMIRSGTFWRAHPELTFLAIYATILVPEVAAFYIASRSLEPKQLRLAYWLTFVLVGAVIALEAPGSIIYFLFAPTLVLFGLLAARRYPAAQRVGSLVGIAVLYVTWLELLGATETIFSPGPVWVVGPVVAIMAAPVLIEGVELFPRTDSRMLVGSAVGLSILAWIVAGIPPAYSHDHQQWFTIEHFSEFPSGHSYWSVLNDGAGLPAAYSKLGPWTRRTFDFSQRQRWIAPAAGTPAVHPAAIDVLASVSSSSGRSVRLRLRTNGAERMLVVAPATARITAAGVPASIRPISAADSSLRFTLSCTGRSCDGTEFVIRTMEDRPVTVTVVGSRNGLPSSAAPLVRARPRFARPQYVPDETVTITHATL